jgi:hypothetical protein
MADDPGPVGIGRRHGDDAKVRLAGPTRRGGNDGRGGQRRGLDRLRHGGQSGGDQGHGASTVSTALASVLG